MGISRGSQISSWGRCLAQTTFLHAQMKIISNALEENERVTALGHGYAVMLFRLLPCQMR